LYSRLLMSLSIIHKFIAFIVSFSACCPPFVEPTTQNRLRQFVVFPPPSREQSIVMSVSVCFVCLCVCLCVCISVCLTSRCSTKTAEHRITQTKPHDSSGTLVFWCQRSPSHPSINQSINVKFVGRRYTRRPGAPTVVSGTHDQKVHS